MEEEFDKYDNPTNTQITHDLDTIQNDLKCCGVNGPADWKNATYMNSISVADGCCKTLKEGCGHDYFDHFNVVEIYEDGCFQAFEEKFMGIGQGMLDLVIAAAVVLLTIFLTTCVTGYEFFISVENHSESEEIESQNNISQYSNEDRNCDPMKTEQDNESHTTKTYNNHFKSIYSDKTNTTHNTSAHNTLPPFIPNVDTPSSVPPLGYTSLNPSATPSFAPPAYSPSSSYPDDPSHLINPSYHISPNGTNLPMYPLSEVAVPRENYQPNESATSHYKASAPPAESSSKLFGYS
ncbi:unnamed protein product, partial [Meganyctiphanes norvegica]